ncbi:autotransporter outer membrane beta-barrel domain-containing protein [Candidatus Tisiphia endosymbiont of Dascillus cervinus]|uniref:autotransporter outer membrane beta-barrel domain-containing protein n=1 Tax=Candidatus Tisiphia endosymbiont of Dascillus cervinus TaxID=3066253 RepID=UPI00312C75BC
MAKKQKFFKYLLASSAIASVVASLGSSGVVFAAPQADRGAMITWDTNLNNIGDDGAGNRTWNHINNDGTDRGANYDMQAVVIAADRPAISYGGGFTLNADILDATITAINLANQNPGELTVNQNLSIGSIVPDAHHVGAGAGRLPIKIEAGHTLTLTGTPAAAVDHGFDADPNTYTGLGAVTLGGAGSTLVVHSDNNRDIAVGNVSAGVHQQGVLTFARAGTVTGTIGATNALAEVNFGIAAGQPNAGGGVVNLRDAVNATDFNINHKDVIVIARGLMTSTGTVNFNAAGRLTAHSGITGNVDFHGNNGTIILGSGKTINGAVNNTGGGGAGILNFAGAGTVTEAIGATNALTVVNFRGTETGVVELQGAAKVTNFYINNNKITVNARGLVKGNVTFNGTGTLNADAGIEGSVDFKGNDGIITLGAGQEIDGNVDNNNVGAIKAGILNFAGDGEVTGAIGAACALAEVNFGNAAGGGVVQLGGAAKVRNFNINNAAANVTAAGLISGTVNFNAAGTLNANGIRGGVNFNGNAGTITLGNNKTITGPITAGGAGVGTLNFAGVGTITKDIGAKDARLARININGATTLRGSVYTNDLHFGNAAGHTVTIGGHFAGGVTFDAANDGILTFNGAAGPYDFDSTIANGNHGTLNVNANLQATHKDIGKIKTINIGAAGVGNNKTLLINASADDVDLLNDGVGGNQAIIFSNANSALSLHTKDNNRTITFHNNLPGFVGVGGGGLVLMDSKNAILTLQSSVGGVKSLGTVNNLTSLIVGGKVTIAGGANGLDIHRADRLSLINGAEFTDKSTTSAQIVDIHIGADAGAGVGPANYILDAEHINFDLNAHADHQIIFDHADAQLTLRNSHAGDRTITLQNNLNPGAPNTGVVEFDSVNAGAELKIAGFGLSLGTAVNKLQKVIFSGDGKFNTQQITINSKNIELNVNELTLGDVNSNILFATNTVFTANGDITGNVDFKNYAGTISLTPNKNINGSIIGGVNGTLEFLGIGAVTSPITNLKMLKAGAGDVRLVGGNYNITEIQGNGNNNLIFANNFNLTGSINSTGGNAVGLTFKGNNRVTGVVGTATSPVGTIQVQGTTVFGDKVQTANDKDIIISAGATAEFANSVTTRNIKGYAADQGTVQFSNAETIIVNSAIGATNAVYTLDIAGADVKITQAVSANYINFSNANKEATLTLEGTSTVGGIRTNGNNVHTLALAADFTTGIQDIGSENNRLKSIKLLGDHKITINSGLYSDISTKTNNTGKVIFNSDRSFAYNLGTNDLKLSDVIFDKNATVRGDVYSKQITIASDKTATFAGAINRTISVPNFTVDGASISRSLKSFAYSTQIGSDEIKNEGIAKFDKAVLVDAKITGGKVTFADNVWFKQTANGKEVNFAADKFVILEQNISFANIKADQAKIIILPKTVSITGNLAAKDLTVDLAANQLKYTGQAQLTGKVELVTASYDTSSGSGGNIEVQTGSKLDLSKADELIIKVKAQTDINKIPEEGAKYVVISSVNGNGLVAIDNSKIKLDPTGEQNRFVKCSMDSSDLKLYITDISKEVIAKEIADKSLSQEEREFYIQLNNVTDRNSSAGKFRNNIGLMDREHALQAMDRILPGNENPIGESLARNPTSEIIRGLMAQADTQITATRMGNSVPMQNAASAIGSGDDDQVMYGVWGSPFYGTACQETYKGVSGYKAKSAGGIVGFDGLVNDNLLLGAAYSRINTQMSHQDKKFGDKTNGKTNIFSLYSLYNLTNNWFTEAIASYGITRVRNSEGRLIATNVKRNVTALETAAAKYKSISYSGQLLTGYNYIASEKLMITPTIGFRYSQFKDAGYTETGTKFQNLVVKKRSYNKFEGILGLRTAATLKANKVLLIPELHGYVNHDFKGKAPIIDARLDGINEPLPTKSVKPVKTFFTVGTGFTAKYNMMECGIIYNVNIASKYIGHQGSLKVKVNF